MFNIRKSNYCSLELSDRSDYQWQFLPSESAILANSARD